MFFKQIVRNKLQLLDIRSNCEIKRDEINLFCNSGMETDFQKVTQNLGIKYFSRGQPH